MLWYARTCLMMFVSIGCVSGAAAAFTRSFLSMPQEGKSWMLAGVMYFGGLVLCTWHFIEDRRASAAIDEEGLSFEEEIEEYLADNGLAICNASDLNELLAWEVEELRKAHRDMLAGRYKDARGRIETTLDSVDYTWRDAA